MKVPDGAPRIYRDDQRIYLEFPGGTIYPFDFTQGGLHKALMHVPRMPGNPADYRKRLNWLRDQAPPAQARDKQGKPVKPTVNAKTKRDRDLAKMDEYKGAADEAIRKLLDKK